MTVGVVGPDDARVPKQMQHWFARAGIYPMDKRMDRDYASMRTSRSKYLAGCREPVRNFRVLPHLARMDIDDGYMDRWANSLAASVPMPTTEAEFQTALAELLRLSEKRVRATWPEGAAEMPVPRKRHALVKILYINGYPTGRTTLRVRLGTDADAPRESDVWLSQNRIRGHRRGNWYIARLPDGRVMEMDGRTWEFIELEEDE